MKFLAGDRTVVVPESVEVELRMQAHERPALHAVLDADWIHVDRSADVDVLVAFSRYEGRLAVGETNRGECGVLALGAVRGFELVIDDSVPRQIAIDEGLRVTATLPLLCQAIRAEQLTVQVVESIADDLLSGKYYLPFQAGGFRAWALEQGLVDY
ncbi:nucleotide-binding protein [Schumannella luteola]|nr:nucleotide-binding protein [Schumannella luteola]